MRRLLTVLLLAAALLPGAPAPAQAAGDVRLGGVTVHLKKGTRQVVAVNHTSGYHARVSFWAKRQGRWRLQFRAQDGRIGYNGLVRPRRRVQGSGKTPLGTYTLPFSFGTHRQRAGWDPSYRKIRRGDYWVLDNQSRFYNRYRNRARGGFRWWLPASDPNSSERLRDFPQQYEFSVVTSFNAGQVRHRGGAIFLHVNGSGATAGCVSAPRPFMARVMERLDQDRAPVIAIGR
jgi:L,D-peptidoglycan transpeptidase YkuD (ErfK/YbiS/YcfS/YnhG family)